MEQIILGNRYQLNEEIGSGGMAHVFKARDMLLDRTVAIKILKPEFTQDAQFIERFRVEAKAAASLSNANIVMIYDVGQDDGIYYIIMEFVDGITLKDYITNIGSIPWNEAAALAIQMTEAIAGAHKNKIIHRDIKPQNILITRDRKIKITDFGIARAATSGATTTVGNAMGSVHYFSPEQAKGSFTDEKSDIYSLGITLYEMTTGVAPFDGETPFAVALKHIQELPVPPSHVNAQIPDGLNAVILKSIAKDQFERYQSMDEMNADLKQVYNDPSGVSLIYAGAYLMGGGAGMDGGAGGGTGGGGGGGGGYGRNADGSAFAQDVRYEHVDGYDGQGGGYANGGDFPDGGDGYDDGYDGEYEEDVYDDGGYDDGAVAGDGMSGRDNRRSNAARGGRAGGGYTARSGARAGARGGIGGSGRGGRGGRGDVRGGRGGAGGGSGGNGGGLRSWVFLGIGLVAAIVAIGFLIWFLGKVASSFNIDTPSLSGSEEEGFAVANYIGRKYEDVSTELLEEGIPSRENRVTNDIIPEGVITGQSVETGLILRRNGTDSITFEVSDGVKRFVVPDYADRGAESRAAEAELRANGLNVSALDEQSGTVPKGFVVRTEPGAGAQLEAGAKITIYISSGSGVTQTSVPQLVGRTYSEARRMIEDALLALGATSPTEPDGSAVVIRQSYAPNTIVDEGVTVDLWLEDAEASSEEQTTPAEPTPTPTATATPEPTPTPTATPDATPTPTPDGAGATPTPDPNAAAGGTTDTSGGTADGQTTGPAGGSGVEQTTTGNVISAEPIDKTVSLTLPENGDYTETVKVLVEATRSDTGRTERVLNRSVMRDDGFPRDITFTIPANGSVELKVYYDGVLMQTKSYSWADETTTG